MKRSLFAFLLFFVAMNAKAVYTSGNYNYYLTYDNCINLFTYSDEGTTTSYVVPSTLVHENQELNVVELSHPAGYDYKTNAFIQNENCIIQEIFIPSFIKRVTRVTRDLPTLKSVVIEDGSNTNLTVDGAFYCSSIKQTIENVIVFNDPGGKITSYKLIGNKDRTEIVKGMLPIT